MNPIQTQELARLKIADELAYAARQRMARDAVSSRPRSIDFSSIGERLRVRLFGGPTLTGKPTGAAA